MPDLPLTMMGAAAAQLHELYTAYCAAGFRDDQAMQLVGLILQASVAAGMQRGPEPGQ